MKLAGSSSRSRAALADVDGRLAGVADPVDDRDHGLAVGVAACSRRGSRRPPSVSSGLSKIGASAKPTAGRAIAATATPPRAWPPTAKTVPASHRLALEVAGAASASRGARARCSCPPGRPIQERSSAPKSIASAASPTPPAPSRPRPPRMRGRRHRARPSHPSSSARRLAFARSCSTAGPGGDRDRARQPQRRRPRARRGRPPAPSWTWADEADQVGELAHRLEVAERGQPLEPERVEVVAGEQREVGVGAAHDPARRRNGAGSPRARPRRPARTRPGPPRRAGRRRRAGRGPAQPCRVARTCGLITESSSRSERRPARSSAAAGQAASARRPPRTPRAAASQVCSIAASSWASETNQASNCEAGG